MRRSSVVRRAVLVGAMALTAALAVPAAAGTSVVGQAASSSAEQHLTTTSTATQSAVDRAAGAATELARVPGYAGVVVDYDTATVTLSWKGEVPPAVGGLEIPDGVTLDVRRTALSEADLRAASTRLLDSQRAARPPVTLLAALPAQDYAGLVVEVSLDPAQVDTARLTQRLQRVAGVPVRIKVMTDHVRSTAGSRRDDAAPWHAGGAIAEEDGTDYCTTGFSVVTASGHQRIVTAAHCSDKVGSVVLDGAGQRLGTVTNRAMGLDAQLIDPAGATTTAGAVYGGQWDAAPGSPRYRFPVTTVQRPAVGQNICSSGAVTGEHCATIRATDVAWTCGKETCHGFRASRDDGGVVVGGGDSGGPMYIAIDGQAFARGMIDGGSSLRDCGRTSVSTQCFSVVYGIPMVDILDHWGARIDK
jgi:streptogrisin D